MAVTACLLVANAAAAQPRELPRVAIADFTVAPSGSTLPPPQLGATMAQLMLHRLVDATQFHVYDPQFLHSAASASRSRQAEEVLRADARGSTNARDAQLAEATRQAVDAASAALVSAASRLTPSAGRGLE
jgi:hypothetical protein